MTSFLRFVTPTSVSNKSTIYLTLLLHTTPQFSYYIKNFKLMLDCPIDSFYEPSLKSIALIVLYMRSTYFTVKKFKTGSP